MYYKKVLEWTQIDTYLAFYLDFGSSQGSLVVPDFKVRLTSNEKGKWKRKKG